MKQFARKILAHAITKLPRGVLTDHDHYEVFQKAGLHIKPVHFYSPIPNTMELDEAFFDKPSRMAGIDRRIDEQVALLSEVSEFLAEYHSLPADSDADDKFSRVGGFADEDGAMLYCMIRKFKPRKIIEIGAGKSTLLSALTLDVNGVGDIEAIDPYPQPFLRTEGRIKITSERIENIALDRFAALEANDILFIDSSHTVRIGGDVIHEILEILPRLTPGVVVHIHDIFLPNHYPKEWVMDRHTFWAEQYLVQAFLAYNSVFNILWGYNMMCAERRDALSAAFPRRQQFGNGSSLWLIKRA